MSSWPWMKNAASTLIDTPVEPVDENDNRPVIADLIEENRKIIDKIRDGIICDPLYDEGKHDDLWILRFVLSHKKSKFAIAACKETLAFRAEHNLDDKDIRGQVIHKPVDGPNKLYADLCDDKCTAHTIPDPQRGVISFIYMGKIDQARFMEKLSDDDLKSVFVTLSEWTHQNLDFITRTTGRLTKTTRFVDLKGITMKRVSMAHNRREGAIMGLMENCYPQMLDKMLIVNPPTWMGPVWRMVRQILPKRVVKKIDLIDPVGNERDRKLLLRYIAEDQIPVDYGGRNSIYPYDW